MRRYASSLSDEIEIATVMVQGRMVLCQEGEEKNVMVVVVGRK